jgi:hypothetical protein
MKTNLYILILISGLSAAAFAGRESGGEDPYGTVKAEGTVITRGIDYSVKADSTTGLTISGAAAELLYNRLNLVEANDAKNGSAVKCRKNVMGQADLYQCYVKFNSDGSLGY